MKNFSFPAPLFFLLSLSFSVSQAQSHKDVIVGFYNVENLFDIENDTAINDEDFLPEGSYQWTSERYDRKLANIAQVITNMNPGILGLGEIENRKVLEDLVQKTKLAPWRYQIVHFDMRDERGIDVALLYRPAVFKPFDVRQIPIRDPEEPGFKTRDILWVKGLFLGDTLHVAVNHWPSRRGGKEDKRLVAAQALRSAVDSVLQINPTANIVIMGDLNDDPNNRSIKRILLEEKKGQEIPLINTSEPTFRRGYGTLAYNGVWNLFDQIIISNALADGTGLEYQRESFTVGSYPYMRETKGKYEGMPMRTFRGTAYNPEGFSDHYPVFIRIEKKP